jgi:bifunctional non-homologous end joining protein LigD
VGGRVLTLTNLDKVIYPATGFTKAEVINYYLQIAPVLLPHITDRVITRVRFPDGVDSASFYEKNAPLGSPDWVRTARIGTSDGIVTYVIADDEATVVWLATSLPSSCTYRSGGGRTAGRPGCRPARDQPMPGGPLADGWSAHWIRGGPTIVDSARAARKWPASWPRTA